MKPIKRERQKEEAMTDEKPPPTPDKTPWEKFTDLARRVIAVPKSEVPSKPKRRKHKHH